MFNGANPLPAAEVRAYAATLRRLLVALGGEIVSTALFDEGEADLLRRVRDESDSLRKLLDLRVGRTPETFDGLGRGLKVLDRVEDEFTACGDVHDQSVGEAR